MLNELVDHDRVLDIAASHVRTMTDVVMQMRQQAAGRIMAGSYLNMYDVNTALEVLTTGEPRTLWTRLAEVASSGHGMVNGNPAGDVSYPQLVLEIYEGGETLMGSNIIKGGCVG